MAKLKTVLLIILVLSVMASLLLIYAIATENTENMTSGSQLSDYISEPGDLENPENYYNQDTNDISDSHYTSYDYDILLESGAADKYVNYATDVIDADNENSDTDADTDLDIDIKEPDYDFYDEENIYMDIAETSMGIMAMSATDPSVTWPSGFTATYGETLDDITIIGGTGDGNFEWTTPTDVVGNVGNQQHSMTFTPDNLSLYNIITSYITVTVNPRSVTITGVTANNKIFDGNTTAEIDISSATIIGALNPADSYLNINIDSATALFADFNVGNGIAVTFSGFTLGGTAASNYVLTAQPASCTADITPLTVIITPKSGQSKLFNAPDPIFGTPGVHFAANPPLKGSDSFIGSLERDPGEGIGEYEFNLGTLDTVTTGLNYILQLDSTPVFFTINKAVPNAPISPVEVASSRTSTSITIQTTASTRQYAIATSNAAPSANSASWVNASGSTHVFSNLIPNTRYFIFTRLAETATHITSPASAPLIVTTDRATLSGTVNISGNAVFGRSLTALTAGLNSNPASELGVLTFQWLRNGTTEIGSNSPIYVLTEADVGANISVRITSSNTVGSVYSSQTIAVSRATRAAPVIDKIDATSQGANDGRIINVNESMEFRFSSDTVYTPVTGTEITGLKPGEYFVRFKETATFFASADTSVTIEVMEPIHHDIAPLSTPAQQFGQQASSLNVNIPSRLILSALEDDIPLVILRDGDSTIISYAALQLIKEADVVLKIELPNGLVISIDPAEITDSARAVNLNIDITVVLESQLVNGKDVPDNSIAISISDRGNFGFSISFPILPELFEAAGISSDAVRLFHVDSEGDVAEKFDEFAINDDGSVTITISHASGYILSEEMPNFPVLNDDSGTAKTNEVATTDMVPKENGEYGIMMEEDGTAVAAYSETTTESGISSWLHAFLNRVNYTMLLFGLVSLSLIITTGLIVAAVYKKRLRFVTEKLYDSYS